ncbi:MAG: aminomethyltransferase beta-barrel domain-containing protein [Alloprevotella sp.]
MGVPFYTIGQRKGLGIALGKPAYVLRLNADKNTIVLGDEQDLLTQAFFVEQYEAVNETSFMSSPSLAVRIRYHAQTVPSTVQQIDDTRLLVRTQHPVSAITPGQSAVFYEGERFVAGAVISSQKGIGIFV